MVVMLRFLNDKREIVKRFLALHHVKDTTSEALKDAYYGILDRHTWGLHHTTLLRLDHMWSSVLKVLSMVDEDGRGPSQVVGLIEKMESFKFAFIFKFMLKLFGITDELSKILQIEDINIVFAKKLVDDVKARLATLRESGWDNLFDDVEKFCFAKGIPVQNMDETIPVRGRSRLEGRTVTPQTAFRMSD
ncbi:zinc finger MYM-type protein [Trifolium repens]|nr:zinc finger MYM-type protein [Trifolium repens]